jgi:dTDP-4-amino-4,6-dideoxygalactose transaminase
MKIPFNKPHLSGKETEYILQAVSSGKISGDGIFSKKCHDFFEKKYGFKRALLTTSCTDAMEMIAILLDVQSGDEIIMPSFTFVSTANAFVLRGATIVFADSKEYHPNIDETKVESLITPKTKAIVAVHYAGNACEMDELNKICKKHGIYLIEDAAQAIESYYKEKPLGSFGCMSAFSFHETKNIISGEGGMLAINDTRFIERAEIVREKGTNRTQFFRGEASKYEWVDIGSSYLPSDIISAFLFAQLENIENIHTIRKKIWSCYYNNLLPMSTAGFLKLPHIPEYSSNNAHIFYLVCKNKTDRDNLIEYLKENGIWAVFHYLPLHLSSYFKYKHDNRQLLNAVMFSETIIRLPLFQSISEEEQDYIITCIKKYFEQ